MTTEIEQLETLIINAVKTGVTDFSVVETWPDKMDLKTLLEENLSTPACYVIYAGTRYEDKKRIGSNTSDEDSTWRMTIIVESVRSREDGTRSAYALIEAVVSLLKGFKVTPLRGFLWPVSTELIAVTGTYYAYGLEFTRRTIS